MFEALVAGLMQVLSWPSIGYLIIGALIGVVIGLLPGLGGMFTLAILLPFAYAMDPVSGLGLLLGAHAVVDTGGGITAILFGTPGSPGTAAMTFDGYPLTKKGKAGLALGANLAASAIGGVAGAFVLAALLPVIRPLILKLGSPEFFLITLLGLAMIALIGEGSTMKSLIAAFFGLFLSMIGLDPVHGGTRFTFGQLYLWEGLSLIPVVIGLFALAEMMDLTSKNAKSISEIKQSYTDLFKGIMITFRSWWLVLRSSAIGIIIGIIPGLGSDTANFISYGHAKQTTKQPEKFGEGNIDGILGPGSSNNAKEGGSLLPTLAFGIPGSASMALILGAFMIWGIQPGPEMLNENLSVTFAIIWILVIGNIVGALLCIPFSFWSIKLTNIRTSIMVPVIILLSVVGALAAHNHIGDIIVACVFGIIGYYMKKYDYSRAVLLIGLVLGSIAESNLNLTLNLYSYHFVSRPISMLLIVMIFLVLFWPLLNKAVKHARR